MKYVDIVVIILKIYNLPNLNIVFIYLEVRSTLFLSVNGSS